MIYVGEMTLLSKETRLGSPHQNIGTSHPHPNKETNHRIIEAEEWINELEDGMVEILLQSRMKKKE